MFRFLARFLGVWLVAAAMVIAVVDGARSIAASQVVLTPLSASWAFVSEAAGRAPVEAGEAAGLPWPFDVALAWLLTAPSAAVLAIIGFALLLAGHKRRERDAFGRHFPA